MGRNDGHILDSVIIHDVDWLQAQYVGNCSLYGVYLTCRIFGSWLYFLYEVNVIFYDTFFWIHYLKDGDCLILMDLMKQVI